MRYKVNFDRCVNQLVPHYMAGRKLILFLQSCLKPLQYVADAFNEYAKETRIEAAMTSQVGRFEWFLNHKFGKYLKDNGSKITVTEARHLGTIFHNETTQDPSAIHPVLYGKTEIVDGVSTALMYWENEQPEESKYDFNVNVPELAVNSNNLFEDGTSLELFNKLLNYWINRYRIATKTFIINYNQPNI